MKRVYVIGSLRNPFVQDVAQALRGPGIEVFDDWMAAGPRADDHWKEYEQHRGRSYVQALKGRAAQQVYNYDKSNLDRADIAVLVLPAGKSGHLELGYMAGKGKPTYILLDSKDDRWDVMYNFATAAASSVVELRQAIILKDIQ